MIEKELAGHLARIKDGRWTKRITEWKPKEIKRRPGRPPTTWTDNLNLIAGKWLLKPQDRRNWRRFCEVCVQQLELYTNVWCSHFSNKFICDKGGGFITIPLFKFKEVARSYFVLLNRLATQSKFYFYFSVPKITHHTTRPVSTSLV